MPNGQSHRLKRACELFVLHAIKEPKEGYNFTKAMIDAGYSEKYARKDAYIVRAKPVVKELIEAEKAKLQARELWNLEQIEREFIEQYLKADQSADRTNALRALESLMKRHGGYTQDAPNPADAERKRKFVESEIIELEKLVQKRTHELAMKPVESEENK